MTKVAIVEDNPTIGKTLASWIENATGHRCVGIFSSGEEALEKLPKLIPNVVLMDIQLPNISGIECTQKLRQLMPQVQVIMVTVYQDYNRIFQALQAGACGYLLKRSSPEEVLQAIAEVRTGGAPMTAEIARRVVESFRHPVPAGVADEKLSPRELEILGLIYQGLSNKEIANHFECSIETVRTHLKRIYEKLHVRSRTEAAVKFQTSRQSSDQPAVQ